MFFVVISIFAILIIVFIGSASREHNEFQSCKSIYSCLDVKDMIDTINFQGLSPFYTGMSIAQIRQSIIQQGQETKEFETSVEFYKMFGSIASIKLPLPPCQEIQSISAHLSNSEQISAISIHLNGSRATKLAMVGLYGKFGNPISSDGEFTIWRDRHMVINFSYDNNTISIIDERLF